MVIGRRLLGIPLLALLALVVSPAWARGQDADFDRLVAPVLIERCLECHSGARPKGKLDLSRKASAARAIVPGNAHDSALWQRVAAGEMPPKKPLSEKDKALLQAWIASGAAWGADP